ncbi:hypothetical protein GC176_27020 [bacterium]|nr:hypothetical protein [bacterium]
MPEHLQIPNAAPRRTRAALPWLSQSACLLLCLILAGCNSSTTPKPGGTGPAGKSTSAPAVVSLDSCLAELQPNEFGINVPVDLPLSALNEWGSADLADRLNPLVDEELLRDDLSQLLDEPQVERVLRRRFVTRDATHARDAIWAQQAVTHVRPENDTAASRITALFYYTVDTVRLSPESTDELPLGPFETAYFGRGSAAARAWVFSTLLNELRVPAAILTLPEGSDAAETPRLVGALLDGQLHLYDVALGLPIPAPETTNDQESSVLPQSVASLAQVMADESLLRQLATEGRPYPVTSEALKQATVEIIGDTTLWSRRMEGLSEALTGDQAVTLYRPLVSTGDLDGAFDSIRDAVNGIIPADRIRVWPWPEARREARTALTAEQAALLTELDHPFQTPLPIVSIGPEVITVGKQIQVPQLHVGNGWRLQLQARISQLQGRTSNAIELYTRIQSFELLPPTIDPSVVNGLPPDLAAQFGSGQPEVKAQLSMGLPEEVRLAHLQAGTAAQFWRAACQFEKRNWSIAARDFDTFLRDSPNGEFSGQARYLGAIAQAGNGQYRRASAFLNSISQEAPEYAAAQYLNRRWSGRSDTGK